MDIHEIEERKNLHINDLMRNHDKAFKQMKTYYNDITNDNLRLIKSLKVWLPHTAQHTDAAAPHVRGGPCVCVLVLLVQ